MALDYISYSAWKDWKFCPFKHKLTRIDKIKAFTGNEHSTFGTAMHDTLEHVSNIEKDKTLLGGSKDEVFDPSKHFTEQFQLELDKLPKETVLDPKLIKEMHQQGQEIAPLVWPAMKEVFGNFVVVKAEQELRQPIDNFKNYDFYGFIDLIIQTEDGKYHIIDWKSCGWGWDLRKRSDTEITYQLTFYKHFFCKMTGADPNDVETHFGLLKRTATKDRIEIFRVTSGAKKTSNALKVLDTCVTNIERKNYVKNRLSCSKCEFHKTIYCP